MLRAIRRIRGTLQPRAAARVDFTRPAGEAALIPADSISWSVFKNPLALFIGGSTAVLLELAEPRVRSGVWDHTTFRTDPLARMQRTGLAAMVTVYAARSTAEKMIRGVNGMHARVRGVTPEGDGYRADDPELLDWVQATASFGFLEAYARFVRPLSPAERDRFYAEGAEAGRLYGALGAPRSCAELDARFACMRPKLEASPIVFEFLEIMRGAEILPRPLRPLQHLLLRASVEITPAWLREQLGLGPEHGLRPWEVRIVRVLGRLADRAALPGSPQALACQRLGLPARWLYRRSAT
jgi:uncharacterized protein (DUF2236 family)